MGRLVTIPLGYTGNIEVPRSLDPRGWSCLFIRTVDANSVQRHICVTDDDSGVGTDSLEISIVSGEQVVRLTQSANTIFTVNGATIEIQNMNDDLEEAVVVAVTVAPSADTYLWLTPGFEGTEVMRRVLVQSDTPLEITGTEHALRAVFYGVEGTASWLEGWADFHSGQIGMVKTVHLGDESIETTDDGCINYFGGTTRGRILWPGDADNNIIIEPTAFSPLAQISGVLWIVKGRP